MKLKHQVVSHFVVDWNDLEQLIKETYGHPYNFVSDNECSNDSEYEFYFEKRPLNGFQQTDLDLFKHTGKCKWTFSTIMQDMINREILDEGNYLIKVSW